MRRLATYIFCATLPLAAGFAFPEAFVNPARAQGLQYEGPNGVSGAVATMPVGNTQLQMGQVGDMTRIAQLEQQIRELTNQLEQRGFEIRQLRQQFDAYVNDTNARLQALEGNMSGGVITGTEGMAQNNDGTYTPADQPPPPNAVQNQGPSQSGVTGTLPDPNAPYQPNSTPRLGQLNEPAPNSNGGAITSGRPQGGPATSPAQAYDQAFAYLQKSNYQDAQNAFADFLKTYPTHPLAANAQYWLGETYFAQTQYSTAAKTFAKAFQDHPQGQKAPDALLKLALTLEKMDKKQDACLTLQELNKRFPSGPASVLRRGEEEGRRLGCQS